MKDFKEWYLMDNDINYSYFGFNEKNDFLRYANDAFNEVLQTNLDKYIIEKNNKKFEAIIQYHTNPLNEKKEDRKVLCSTFIDVKMGDYLKINDKLWLIINTPKKNQIYQKFQIYQTNNILRWKDENDNLHEVPCIIEKAFLGVKEGSRSMNKGSTFLFDTTSINISIGYSKKDEINLITDEGDSRTRFILGDKTWVVNNIDKVTKMDNEKYGLYNLDLSITESCDQDDFKNKIAFNEYKNKQKTKIKNKEQKEHMFIDNEDKNGDVIYYGDEEEYLIYNNDDNLKFTWSIDNEELAKIMKQENNKCLIKANDCRKYGEIILTAKNENITLKKKIRIKDFLFG